MKAGGAQAAMNPVSAPVLRILDRCLQAVAPDKAAPDVVVAAAGLRHDPELQDAVAELLTSESFDPPRLAAALGLAVRMSPAAGETGPFQKLGSADPIRRIYTRCKAACDRAGASDRDNSGRHLAALLLSAVVVEWTSLGTPRGRILRGRNSDPGSCGHLTAVLQRRKELASAGPGELEEGADVKWARIAAAAAKELAGAPARDIIAWAVETFGDRICITSSMNDAVIIQLATSVRPGMDVIFLDTGYHFAETIGTRDAVAAVYPVNLINVTPSRTVPEQDAELGPKLYARNPDLCCYLRKVKPLEKALGGYDAWITGIRQGETDERDTVQVVEWDGRRGKVKINPIASWTQEEVDDYIAENGVLVNPLVYDGYPSIGCATCTVRAGLGADPRGGRWAGTDKTECGIHPEGGA